VCGTLLLQDLERKAYQSGIGAVCLNPARRRPLAVEFYRKHSPQATGWDFNGSVETVQFRKTLDERALLSRVPSTPWEHAAK
jgi:hypothetical protein